MKNELIPRSRNFLKTFSTAVELVPVPGQLPNVTSMDETALTKLDARINEYASDNNLYIEGVEFSITTSREAGKSAVVRYSAAVRFVDYNDWLADKVSAQVAAHLFISGEKDDRNAEGSSKSTGQTDTP